MKKWALSSDQQFPRHDPKAIELWFKFLDHFKPDVIDYLGDTEDQDEYSRWAEGRSKEFLKEQENVDGLVIDAIWKGAAYTREFYQRTRKEHPNAEIHLCLGNHDKRVFEYIDKKIPHLIDQVTPDWLWDLNKLGIDYIDYHDMPKLRYGGFYVHHGNAVSKHSGESVKADMESWNVSLVRGHCFSSDTEILTDTGWKTYDQIDIGSNVYTMNMQTGLGEFQAVSEKFVYDNYDELVSISGKNVDALVTDEHKMVVRGTRQKDWRYVDAKDIAGRFDMPLACKSTDDDYDISDERLRLLAWIIAEANLDEYGNGRFRVRISQSDAPDGRLERIRSIISDNGYDVNWIKRYSADTTEHGTYRNYDAYRASLPANEIGWIFDYVDENKYPRQDISLSARQAKIFLEEYVWSDGCKNSAAKNSYQVASKDVQIIDFLQRLAVTAGYRSSVTAREKNGAVFYTLTFNTRSTACLDAEVNISRVEYDGDVWCVTVPNHTVVVRRNGKTFVAGNSHRAAHIFKTFEIGNRRLQGIELGHMCDPNQMDYSNVRNWQQAFAYGYIDEQTDTAWLNLAVISEDYRVVVDGSVISLV